MMKINEIEYGLINSLLKGIAVAHNLEKRTSSKFSGWKIASTQMDEGKKKKILDILDLDPCFISSIWHGQDPVLHPHGRKAEKYFVIEPFFYQHREPDVSVTGQVTVEFTNVMSVNFHQFKRDGEVLPVEYFWDNPDVSYMNKWENVDQVISRIGSYFEMSPQQAVELYGPSRWPNASDFRLYRGE